jgi:2-dehydropantoate 2-reductase
MNFLCFGVGAIGTYIGGSLAASGQKVVFVERPEVVAEVRARGLSVQVGELERRVDQPSVVGSLAEALAQGPFDAAILAVKSFDTPAVMAEAARMKAQMPPVLCLQNGVENEGLIGNALGAAQVITGTVTTAVGRRAAGSISVEKLRGVGIAVDHPAGAGLVAAFNTAGLRARAYPNGPSIKWSKMVTNLLANASSAILDMPPAEIFAHAGLFRLEMAMIKEALAVMAAQSIAVTDLPATPVRALTMSIQLLPVFLSQPLLVQQLGKGRGAKMPSFHIDLYAGRGQSEVDFLNGAVVRFGERFKVATPVNRWLTQTLLAITAGKMAKSEYAHQPEKMIRAVNAAGTRSGGR